MVMIVYFGDAVVEGAINITVDESEGAVGVASFEIPSLELDGTTVTDEWTARLQQSIYITAMDGETERYVFIGFINSVTPIKDSILVACLEETAKLKNNVLDASESNFIKFEGKVTSAVTTTLTVTLDDGTNPGFTNDEYIDDYVMVSDLTNDELTEDIENTVESCAGVDEAISASMDDQTGDYTDVNTSPADYLKAELQTGELNGYMEIDMGLAGFEIANTVELTRIRIQATILIKPLLGSYVDTYTYGLYVQTNGTSTQLHLGSWRGIEGQDSGVLTIDRTFEIRGHNDIYATIGASFWEDLNIRIYLYRTKTAGTTELRWYTLQVALSYETDAFSQIDVIITDNTANTIVSGTNFQTAGVAGTDGVKIIAPASDAIALIGQGQYGDKYQDTITIDDPLRGYPKMFVGIDSKQLLDDFIKYFSYLVFYDYINFYLKGVKLSNTDEQSWDISGWSEADVTVEGEIYGAVMIFFNGGVAVASTGLSSSKIYKETRKDIYDLAIAQKQADELAAEKYGQIPYAIHLKYKLYRRFQVGYTNATITVRGNTYEHQLVRRVKYTHDGSLGVVETEVWLGMGSTPATESIGKTIGLLKRQQMLEPSVSLSSALTPTRDHGAFLGLADDDHTQYLLRANDAGNAVTEIDTAATIADSDTKIPTSKRVKDALDLKAPLASPTFTGTVTMPSSITTATYEKAMMLGADNAAWVPCVYYTSTVVGKWLATSGRLSNVDGSDNFPQFQLPLPLNKNGLKLYVSGIQIGVYDADTGDYVNSWGIVSHVYNGTTTHKTQADDGSWSALDGDPTAVPQLYEFTFTGVDMSARSIVYAYLGCVVTDANDLDLMHVSLKCYYA